MGITELSAGVSSYALLRKVLEITLDDRLNYPSIKGWPFSSWMISILHDLVIIPFVSSTGDTDRIYFTACCYYLADFIWFARAKSFQGLLYHHLSTILVIAIALIHLNKETRKRYCSNILYLTLGSGVLNIRGVTRILFNRRIPDTLIAFLYLTSRLLVIRSLKSATRLEIAISSPLMIHNLSIVYKLLVRNR